MKVYIFSLLIILSMLIAVITGLIMSQKNEKEAKIEQLDCNGNVINTWYTNQTTIFNNFNSIKFVDKNTNKKYEIGGTFIISYDEH